MRILPSGDRALLLELDDLQDVWDWYATVRDAALPGVVDLVPAARTLLVVVDPARVRSGPDAGHPDAASVRPCLGVASALDGLVGRLRAMHPVRGRRPDDDAGDALEVPVVYDGEDLTDVARLLDCDIAEVVRRHTSASWSVAFCGFAPGFGYLVPDGEPWAVPRRDVPRTRVPQGSVGLADAFTGVYPRSSPGGWQLLGRTTLELFDPCREPAALLVPGRRVRFRDTTPTRRVTSPGRASSYRVAEVPLDAGSYRRSGRRSAGVHAPAFGGSSGVHGRLARGSAARSVVNGGHVSAPTEPALTVIEPGPSTTVQDVGRIGRAGIGVSPSGAADRASYALANRLVGNDFGAAALEVTFGGLVLRAEREMLLAVTGAPCPGGPVNGTIRLRRGDEVRLGTPDRGLRTYVAVRGGLAVSPVLGSCATDVLSGIGPGPVAAGDVLMVAGSATRLPPIDLAPVPPVGVAAGETAIVRVLAGPRGDRFDASVWHALTNETFAVTAESNRVGLRLDGPWLGRASVAELPSEGLVRGAVQVPPSGQPLMFLADHPTTGGYPVIAYVVDEDVDAVAQLRPGDRVRLRAARG